MARKLLAELSKEWLIVPILRAELMKKTFKGFSLRVEGWKPRPYDGKFHPSTHATWSARQLALYLTHPEDLLGEDFDLTSILAITQGKFWHLFVQKVLLRHGILQRAELPIHDDELNITGHIDGLGADFSLFELKTMNDWKLGKIHTLEVYRELYPEYYAQNQDYLMVTGHSVMRVVLMSMSSPYHMVEFVVPADDVFQKEQREKYLEALALAEAGEMGDQCCPIFSSASKKCPVRLACPIGGPE